MGMGAGALNAYYCYDCEGYVVTVDRDDGVTPMFLACRVKGDPDDAENDCKGQMHSMMYPPLPWPAQAPKAEPTWEWYAPSVAERRAMSPAMLDHVERGGLELRKIAE